METITAAFCPFCKSQVRKNEDGQYIGYTEGCSCSGGLDKKKVRFFQLLAKSLKSSFGFVLETNNSIVTFAQAVDKYGRFSICRFNQKSPV